MSNVLQSNMLQNSLLPCPIKESASKYPNNYAIINDKESITYLELDHLVNSISNALLQHGVEAGSHIAFFANKSIKTIAYLFALLRIKAVACPINAKLPKNQHDSMLQALNAPIIDALSIPETSNTFETLDPNLPATLLFTSGSTAKPKIACHSIANFLYSAYGTEDIIGLKPTDRYLLSLPLFHVGGLLIPFRSFCKASTVVISEMPLEAALTSHNIDYVSLVPTQLWRLLHQNQEDCNLSYLKGIILGGAPISALLVKEALKSELPIFTTYGLTEMTSQVTLKRASLKRVSLKRASLKLALGSPLEFREMSIASDGEILVRGKTLFLGYYEKNNGIALPLNSDGWFATKDLGRLENGELIFDGRKDNLFITGGENVQPEEIENELLNIPNVTQAIVVPVPNEEYGERPVAFLEMTGFCKETIRDALKEKLPSFKIPDHFFPLPIELINKSLKISRKELKEIAVAFLKSSRPH